MVDDEKIVELIEALAGRTFPGQMVEGVKIRRDFDQDGDPIVWVNVLMKDGAMPLDPRVTLPFGLALRHAMEDLGEAAAPVLSFYPGSDFRQIYPEAA